MKTDICAISNDKSTYQAIFTQVEKAAGYNGLEKKQALHLRLLAEELVSMLPELLEVGSGEFWIENSGREFELHASIQARSISAFDKENIIAVSSSGKNAAAKGILSKIELVAANMLGGFLEGSQLAAESGFYDFYDMGAVVQTMYINTWSLNSYKENVNDNTEEWDELEKSIIANLADDVIVGVKGKKVDIIIKKRFD